MISDVRAAAVSRLTDRPSLVLRVVGAGDDLTLAEMWAQFCTPVCTGTSEWVPSCYRLITEVILQLNALMFSAVNSQLFPVLSFHSASLCWIISGAATHPHPDCRGLIPDVYGSFPSFCVFSFCYVRPVWIRFTLLSAFFLGWAWYNSGFGCWWHLEVVLHHQTSIWSKCSSTSCLISQRGHVTLFRSLHWLHFQKPAKKRTLVKHSWTFIHLVEILKSDSFHNLTEVCCTYFCIFLFIICEDRLQVICSTIPASVHSHY